MEYSLPEADSTTVEIYVGNWSRTQIVNPSLSVRCMFTGSADYRVDSRRSLVLGDEAYLVLNEEQVYDVEKSGTTPVESLCIFFPSAWVNHLSALNVPASRLLDDPFRVAPTSLGFRDHTRAHDYAVTPYLLYLRRSMRNLDVSDVDMEESLMGLLQRLFLAESLTQRGAEKLAGARRPTRIELHRRICVAKDFMDANLMRRFSLREAATAAGVSPFHFLRAFQQVFGRSPNTYVIERRVAIARRLLTRTDRRIDRVALEVGYESHPTFCRIFKQHTGMSPSQYRNLFRSSVNSNIG